MAQSPSLFSPPSLDVDNVCWSKRRFPLLPVYTHTGSNTSNRSESTAIDERNKNSQAPPGLAIVPYLSYHFHSHNKRGTLDPHAGLRGSEVKPKWNWSFRRTEYPFFFFFLCALSPLYSPLAPKVQREGEMRAITTTAKCVENEAEGKTIKFPNDK
jgi:hypothetical protein